MAQFNNEIITDDEKLREKAKQECGMYLQSCLTSEELERPESRLECHRWF